MGQKVMSFLKKKIIKKMDIVRTRFMGESWMSFFKKQGLI